jgi:hypothetical protein
VCLCLAPDLLYVAHLISKGPLVHQWYTGWRGRRTTRRLCVGFCMNRASFSLPHNLLSTKQSEVLSELKVRAKPFHGNSLSIPWTSEYSRHPSVACVLWSLPTSPLHPDSLLLCHVAPASGLLHLLFPLPRSLSLVWLVSW